MSPIITVWLVKFITQFINALFVYGLHINVHIYIVMYLFTYFNDVLPAKHSFQVRKF
jgi:hypothetical protein